MDAITKRPAQQLAIRYDQTRAIAVPAATAQRVCFASAVRTVRRTRIAADSRAIGANVDAFA
jgi:hypothetical protein